MDENMLSKAENIVNALSGDNTDRVKYVKRDKSLIERAESSKIILTEDNRQILND
jgi:hypothetical protein